MNHPLITMSLALLSLLPLAATAAPGNQKSIQITHIGDFSGPSADFARDFSTGAKVYFDHLNASGGIKGKRILYRLSDSAGQSAQALSAAQEAINERSDVVLFGITGDQTLETLARDPRVHKSGAPLFATVAGNTSLGLEDGVFHLRAGLADETQAIIRQLKSLGVSTFSLAAANDQLADAAKLIENEASAQGARLIGRVELHINP